MRGSSPPPEGAEGLGAATADADADAEERPQRRTEKARDDDGVPNAAADGRRRRAKNADAASMGRRRLTARRGGIVERGAGGRGRGCG
mmetsp:Transcript_19184/g.38195  ORF Transcript_19184/g.38195 Transcript_19184/m.38195 type:complete len:88 (+) Transcript_19184:337-600(+)